MKGFTLSRAVAVPASVAAGAAVSIADYDAGITMKLGGTFVATVQFEESLDGGTTWIPVGAAQTVKGSTALTGRTLLVRANTTAFTSGVPVAWATGPQAAGA